ncbi:GNAT family N-acetyltransferase [Plastorhodobacter daqingensis]|uniref:GNAT family N-acetyltransferase n=1 Tax=Plastorhodobacter daqingensis TaxID=1387281 RepID=A0ABW2UI70_9RHOB
MRYTITASSPLTPKSRALIDDSQHFLQSVFPPEEIFSFSAEELATPNTTFLVAADDEGPLGCVALVNMDSYGEVKRLFLRDRARGRGIGRALMEALEARARALGLPVLRLETGPALAAACALYQAMGYRPCPPFGGYPDIPSNLFMEKTLTAP